MRLYVRKAEHLPVLQQLTRLLSGAERMDFPPGEVLVNQKQNQQNLTVQSNAIRFLSQPIPAELRSSEPAELETFLISTQGILRRHHCCRF